MTITVSHAFGSISGISALLCSPDALHRASQSALTCPKSTQIRFLRLNVNTPWRRVRESNPQGREARLFSKQVPSPNRMDSPVFLLARQKKKVGPGGVEPPARRASAYRSTPELRSSMPRCAWHVRQDSNLHPAGLEAAARPVELRTCVGGRDLMDPSALLVAAPGVEPGSLAYETSVLAPGPSRIVWLRR